MVKSPGCPARRRRSPRLASGGWSVIGELELAWRLLPNRFVAVTGTNGKTTVAELLGHVWRTAGEPVAVAGNVGTPLASLVGEIDAEATVVCEASSFQLEDTDALRARVRGAAQPRPRPPRPPRHPRRLPATRSCAIFANQGNDDVAVYNARSDLAATSPAARADRLGRGAARLRASPTARARRRRAAARCRAAPARRAQRRQRDGGRRGGARGSTRDGDPRRAARASPASRTGSSAVAEIDGVALRQRLEGDQRRRGRRGAALVRRRRPRDPRRLAEGRRLRRARRAGRRALPRLLPDRRGRGAARARARAGARRRRRAPPLRRPRRPPSPPRRPTRAPGEVVLLAPACASFDAYRDFEQRGEHFREPWSGSSSSMAAERAKRSRAPRSSTRCCSPRPCACSPSAW